MAPYRLISSKPTVPSNHTLVPLAQPNTRVVKQRRHHHVPAGWENIKPVIVRLYVEEQRKVEDVIYTLKSEFDFNTGRRLLLDKIKEWGIQKNKKRNGDDTGNATAIVEGRTDPPSQTVIAHVYRSPSMPVLQLRDSSSSTFDVETWEPLPGESSISPWVLSNVTNIQPEPLTHTVIRTRASSPIIRRSYDHALPESREPFSFSPQVTQEMSIPRARNQAQLNSETVSALEENISRLLDFITEKAGVIYQNNSSPLKEDLRRFLDLSQAVETIPKNCILSWPYHDPPNLAQELSIVSNLINSARRIGVNTNINSLSQIMPRAPIRWQQKRIEIRIGTSTIFVTVKSGTYLNSTQHDTVIEGPWQRFSTKVLVKPCNSIRAFEIEVSQCELPDGSFSSIPKISVNNVVPFDSLVFKAVESGSVQDLMALFSSGQANLRDRDPHGRSLLHYSTRNPPMCQFLARSGLDVDETVFRKVLIGPRLSTIGIYATPLHYSAIYLQDAEVTEILLTEGADPTVSVDGREGVIGDIFTYWRLPKHEILRQILDISGYFGVANLRDRFGRTLLLSFCGGNEFYPPLRDPFQRYASPEITIQILLDRVSNIEDRSTEGSNCLHLFFRKWLWPPSEQSWVSALIRLVKHGADVYAADRSGVTVSQIAYAESTCLVRSYHLGSYRGDLWDAVLHSCGYNLLDFRKLCRPRRAKYTKHYTRQDFEELWDGRQDECPYWDDNEWPADEGNGEVDNFGTDEKILCVCQVTKPTMWVDAHYVEKCCPALL
ncbi:hypothetical protein GGR58DRAFT_523841 [Xylaria digitata]|nr:hypothetical protein GGR58DRAFT_523841 [Xylaria digitata]